MNFCRNAKVFMCRQKFTFLSSEQLTLVFYSVPLTLVKLCHFFCSSISLSLKKGQWENFPARPGAPVFLRKDHRVISEIKANFLNYHHKEEKRVDGEERRRSKNLFGNLKHW